ncbi:MAG TPA: cation:proton antiporter [Blastocatellia bacterium]|nr:cation:proton antiporter [Blastocatellia bacterium]
MGSPLDAFLLLAAPRGQVLLSLFLVLVAAKLAAELFERLRQPAVVGEIIAGVIIGPAVLNIVQPTDVLEALAEVGVVFLLFTVGLETRPSDIFKVGGRASVVAVLGVIIPFVAGWGLLSLWPGHSWVEAVFLGTAMVATSVGITVRVLSGMGLITAEASRVILAAAVIDDVIGLLVLAVTTSLATGRVNYFYLGLNAALAIGFAVLIVSFGTRVVGGMRRRIGSLRIDHSLLVFALVLCFGLAALASVIGIAGIVGAFLAGVALSEATEGTGLHRESQALTEFTTPFFLAIIGMKLNLAVFSSRVLLLSLAVIILAILTKLVGCGLGAARMGRRRAVQVGVGMIPRGEVGIVVAQIGIGMAAISDAVYGVVLTMVVITTIAAPPLIKLAFASEKRPEKVPGYTERLEEIG